MNKTTLELGNIGEKHAESFLKKNGYQILEKNWRTGNLEIDIICKDKIFLCIVEVKTRKSKSLTTGEFSVNKRKQQNLINAASNYIKYKKLDLEVRFDIISIEGYNEDPKIEHIKNAFKPIWQY